MKKTCFFIMSTIIVCGAKAQTIMVHPGGTHSTGINHGHATTVINSHRTRHMGIHHGAATYDLELPRY